MTSIIRKFNGVFESVRRAEASIASSVEGAASRLVGPPGRRQPLELVHAIVEAVVREVQPAGRGRNTFPFNVVRVTLLAATPRERARIAAVVDGAEPLSDRIGARLRAAGCIGNPPVVTVSYSARRRPGWTHAEFDVECLKADEAPGPDAVTPRLDLDVASGTALRRRHSFSGESVAIGRGADIVDRQGRLVRINQVAFDAAADEISRTVSRLHAHIDYDPASRRYRLFDDGSTEGTSVIRQGRGHRVVRGGPGLVLGSGDEIVVGSARLKVTLAP